MWAKASSGRWSGPNRIGIFNGVKLDSIQSFRGKTGIPGDGNFIINLFMRLKARIGKPEFKLTKVMNNSFWPPVP